MLLRSVFLCDDYKALKIQEAASIFIHTKLGECGLQGAARECGGAVRSGFQPTTIMGRISCALFCLTLAY